MITVPFSSLTTTNLGALGNRTIVASERTANETITAQPLLAEIRKKSEVYDAVVLKQIYSGMGTTVEGADLYRDRVYQNVKRMLQGFAGFTDTTRGKAAATLLRAFDETGSIYGLSYADESTVLNKLITLLGTDENRANITAVGIEEEAQLLADAQTHFQQVFFEQVEANAGLRKQPSASSIRHELEDALRDYFAFVSAMRKIEPWSGLYLSLRELAKAARLSNLPDKPLSDNVTPTPETPAEGEGV